MDLATLNWSNVALVYEYKLLIFLSFGKAYYEGK